MKQSVCILLTGILLVLLPSFFASPAWGEKIPALVQIPPDLALESRVQLMKKRQALERELADFQKAAAVFNSKDAKEQSDSEYTALDAWRTRYINAAKDFNRDVDAARQSGNDSPKVTSYIVGLTSMRGEFSIQNSDGAKLSNQTIKKDSVIRIDSGTHVTTGSTGRLQFILPDETVFTLGPNCDVIMDNFVYDTDMSPRKIMVQISKGIFRWVTGKVVRKDPASMKVTLPVGTIGIRGTEFEVLIQSDGSGYINLFSGMLAISPRNSTPPFVMEGRTTVKITAVGTFSRPEPVR